MQAPGPAQPCPARISEGEAWAHLWGNLRVIPIPPKVSELLLATRPRSLLTRVWSEDGGRGEVGEQVHVALRAHSLHSPPSQSFPSRLLLPGLLLTLSWEGARNILYILPKTKDECRPQESVPPTSRRKSE